MSEIDLVVRARRTVTPDGERPAATAVRNGKIVGLHAYDAALSADEQVDLGELALLPGLVDTHVHVNEPGRTHWEGFASATRAAAAGGVTTIVDMPLNSLPPTVTPEALEIKRKAAAGQCFVDVGFWGGAIPGNLGELRGLHEAGVFGVKCFLSPSGVEEFPSLSGAELRAVLIELARFDGLPIVHAEDPGSLSDPVGPTYPDFLASRPPVAERRAVDEVMEAVRATGGRAHIVHVSAAACVEPLRAAQRDGVRITAETCPHYLTLAAEAVTGPAYKCCPPIREAANQDALWAALADGVLMGIVSDHSPSTPDLKVPDFAAAWGGIASLQVGLPAVWTAARARGHGLGDVVRWMSAGPARLVGLRGKGAIDVGRDADLVAFDPDASFTVDVAELHHKNPVSPYHGLTLTGVVRETWLRGVPVAGAPHGELLARSADG